MGGGRRTLEMTREKFKRKEKPKQDKKKIIWEGQGEGRCKGMEGGRRTLEFTERKKETCKKKMNNVIGNI